MDYDVAFWLKKMKARDFSEDFKWSDFSVKL